MKKYIFITLFFIISGCDETLDTTYKDYNEAKEKGATIQGWVPEWFPTRASEIRETHNLDTNGIIIVWKNKGKWSAPENCSQIGSHVAPKPGISRSWWPSDIPASELHIFYSCGAGEYLAMDPNSEENYYWRVNR